ncbi:MAG: Lrp/AsnC family transcriptional regulator [Theionarchaea archaeon]|nr:Lrp/AsnC family transcriptional regulator [Theionarchaea archaeon]
MLKEKLGLDEKDRKIISLLEENPQMSQSDIAKEVNLSQPSVGVRIRKLGEKGAVHYMVGMNFKTVGLNLAKVDVTAEDTPHLLEIFGDCPFFLNGLITSGQHNLCMFFMGEDVATLEAIIDRHLRSNPLVSEVNFDVVVAPIKDFVFPVKLEIENQTCELEVNCRECAYYNSNRCLGCPITPWYRGKFWPNPR